MRMFRRLLRAAALAGCCATILSAAPSIASVYNGASWTPAGLPNSGVAQGSIFTLTGSGLGPASLQQVQAYPLPTTQGLGGTTIQVTVGSTTETCIMIYTVGTQVAAILPSATPVGSGTLTLTYSGAKSSIPIQVLAANFGTFTLNEGGSGPAVITDTSYNAITMINAAHPGETLILWGTGLGAVTGDETEPPTQVDLGTGVQVFIGNQPATVLYGGRGSSPGLDQINFVVPAGVSGCKSSVAVLVKGVTGNVTSISVSPAGQTTCGDTYGPLTVTNLQKAISSGTLNLATVQMSRIGGGTDELLADFGSYPLNSLIRSYGGGFGPSIGSCLAYEVSGSSLVLADPIQPTQLSAGASLVVTGPAGTKTVVATSTGLYGAALSSGSSLFIEPGSYTLTNGSGTSSVAAFTWPLTLPASVVPASIPTHVTRSQDLTLTWSGSSPFSVVTILGYAGVAVTSSVNSYVEFICNAPASASQFTIPSAILNLIPTGGYGSPGVPGLNLQIAGDPLDRFSVAGSPGIDAGILSAFITAGGIAAIQ